MKRRQDHMRPLLWTILASVVVSTAPLGAASSASAQEAGVTRRVVEDQAVGRPPSDGAITATRITLAPSERTESLLLDGPVVVAVETGTVKVWTRTGTTLDGVRVFERTASLVATKEQTISVPDRVRFRLRALGCAPAKLLFVRLVPREPAPER